MPTDGVRGVIDLWADQTTDLGAENRWVQIFENRGEAMGASNPHPHGQIWAGTALPERAAREDAMQRGNLQQHGRRLLLDVAAQESGGIRVVDEGPSGSRWCLRGLAVELLPPRRSPNGCPTSTTDNVMRSPGSCSARRHDGLLDQPMPFDGAPVPFVPGPTDHWQVHALCHPCSRPPSASSWSATSFSEPQRDITAEEAAERPGRRAEDAVEVARPAAPA
jgi:UDPglucose--hexose-1-phosphate uridylyltransferase